MSTRILRDTELFKRLNTVYQELFTTLHTGMTINQIVPIYRPQHKGVKLGNPVVKSLLEAYLIKNKPQPLTERTTEDIHKVILFLEGAILVSDSVNAEAKALVQAAVNALLAVEKKIDFHVFTKLSHCIVATGVVIDNEALKELLLRFLRENIKDDKLPAELKRNLLKLVQQACINKQD